jgi:hypothetical protein
MKELSSWGHLHEFGIDCLTGEACAVGNRLLCDVTKRGKMILETMLGSELTLKENWNSGASKYDPHIGSIMLPRQMFSAVAIWCLFSAGTEYAEVWAMTDGTVRGLTIGDLVLDDETGYWDRHADQIGCKYKNTNQPEYRNQHAMSGRIV